MTLKKMTTYMDEDLLREAKVFAAQSDAKIYEVIDAALRRYLEAIGRGQPGREQASPEQTPLAEAVSGRSTGSPGRHPGLRMPGVPREDAAKQEEGDTLSEAVVAERGDRGY